MRSPEIRDRFLHYFEDRGHLRIPSASLIPDDDPTLLFVVAGMVPMKPYLLGLRTPPSPNATSCQKVFRTVDIEQVGRTPRHHTFFEMLGNFSFGEYFKERAIELAWELLTEMLAIDPDRLWPSTHPDDDEAHRLWTERIGVPAERMTRLEDNFWAAGPVGPCGYDSEVYFDRRVDCSCGRAACRPGCEGDRFLEVWNLVFMEFDRDASGTLRPLARPGIDTGMGLERIAAVLQDVPGNFDTDLLRPLIGGFASRGTLERPETERTVALRVLADHLRGSTFLIADGVTPATTGRGYVLRHLIRRAALHGRRLGLRGGLEAGVGDVVELMGETYPELVERRSLVESILHAEEAAFERTLEEGAERLETLLQASNAKLDGQDAFRLYDTYGFPIELTVELAGERGVEVDTAGYEEAREQHRERSRVLPLGGAAVAGASGWAAGAFTAVSATGGRGGADLESLPEAEFTGYDWSQLRIPATVLRTGLAEGSPPLPAGAEGVVLLDRSPFYAESGGQVGDTGELSWPQGRAAVLDTTPVEGSRTRAHRVRVDEGRLVAGTTVTAAVDVERRTRTARHHSATHLLHAALREVLGSSAAQRGSMVGPDRTTFDFSFPRQPTTDELLELERRVNAGIRANWERRVDVLPIDEARATGAVAIFEERYGDVVRVVDFGGWSRELCGGTHVSRSGDLGAAIITSESSIGQGIRRIEMVVGDAAERRWEQSGAALREAAVALRARPEEVPDRVAQLQTQLKHAQRELVEERRRVTTRGGLGGAAVEQVDGLSFAHLTLDEPSRDAVVAAADILFAERVGAAGVAVVLGSRQLAVKVGAEARTRGVSAGELVRLATGVVGGRGGGRADFAQGAVVDASKRAEAIDAVRDALAGARSR